MASQNISRQSHEALELLGASVRAARLRRKWSMASLAERVGVSRPTIEKVEQGDPGVAIGTAFEAARVVGVPLFDPDPEVRRRYAAQKATELSLLPAAARQTHEVDDDF